MILVFMLCTVNQFSHGETKSPRVPDYLGLIGGFASFGNYVGIVPELAARQAQGIIMGEAPRLRLSCPFQFGTAFLLLCRRLG
jgi:hypothetical protein